MTTSSANSGTPKKFPSLVPIFPLPGLVMFPNAVLPLHIFESRYRAMTRAALGSDGMLAIATLAPGHESDYDLSPPIWPVGCVGRIEDVEELPDGRFNFRLVGLARVRFGLELPADPYRRAHVEVLEEPTAPEPAREAILRQTLQSLLRLLASNTNLPAEPVAELLRPDLPLAELTDRTGFVLPAEPRFKQRLLEELDAAQRAVTLAVAIQGHIQRLGITPRRRPNSDPSWN